MIGLGFTCGKQKNLKSELLGGIKEGDGGVSLMIEREGKKRIRLGFNCDERRKI